MNDQESQSDSLSDKDVRVDDSFTAKSNIERSNKKSRGQIFHSKGIKFISQMSAHSTERNLLRLFCDNIHEAINNKNFVADRLSAYDLRIIVRNLKLCEASQINLKKPILIGFLQNYLKDIENLEFKISEIKQSMSKDSNTAEKQALGRSKRVKPENTSSNHHEQTSSPKISQSDTSLKHLSDDHNDQFDAIIERVPNNSDVLIPRLKLDKSFDLKEALNVIQRCNEFVIQVTEKISELERAVSIMSFKIAELSKLYD